MGFFIFFGCKEQIGIHADDMDIGIDRIEDLKIFFPVFGDDLQKNEIRVKGFNLYGKKTR